MALTPSKGGLIQCRANHQIWTERLKSQFIAKGYRVVEVPGISLGRAGSRTKQRFINYTNSPNSGAHALVPELGYPTLDLHFKNLMHELGYQTIPMPSAQSRVDDESGLGYATNVFR